MKWGVRRYQNKDGSLTSAGRKRYDTDIDGATANVEQAKKQKAAAAAAYNKATLGGMVYNEKATNDLLKATNRVDWAKEKLSSEKVKEKLNAETKEKSKHRLKLEEEYRSKGMSEEEAAVAAYKRVRTEKIIAATAGVTIAAATAYVAYKHYDKTVDKFIKAGTDIDLLIEEGVSEADVVICLTEDDKLNLLLAQLAKHLGARKTIVRVARNEYIELMEKVGVDIVLSSRLLSAGEVLRFVRKGGIVSVSLLEGAQAEALEIIVGENSDVDGVAVRDMNLPPECLLCAIVRGNEAYIPNGNTVLHANDRVILFIKSEFSKTTVPLFEGRGA